MSRTVRSGQAPSEQDANDVSVYNFDWDHELLRANVQISGSATWTISAVAPASATLMTKDNESILSAALATIALERTVTVDNRVAQVRLQGGDPGAIYNIACKITTNESPSQTKEQSFKIRIRQR